MKIAILLFCAAFAFGQDASPAPGTPSQPPANSVPEQKQQSAGSGIQQAAQAAADRRGSVDILSDTQGIDFGPYLQRVIQEVRENWFSLIPASEQMKKGKLAIEFAIAKDGRLGEIKLVASSGDAALDRPAWGSITASNPFEPLPKDFTGPYLALRFRFYYNPDKADLQ